ncbi:MAG: hypothetical protein ACTSSG_11650 [Candidatus Heimdallarchaeaceae archaeon]
MTEKKEQKSGILKNINVDIFILLIAGIIGIIVSVVLVFFDTENTTAIIIITIISCTSLIIASIESVGKNVLEKLK